MRLWPLAHRVLYRVPVLPVLQAPIKIDKKLIAIILGGLAKRKTWPSLFLGFFFHIHLDRREQEQFGYLLKPKNQTVSHMLRFLLPAVYFQTQRLVLDDGARDYFENRSPSFARAFYRSLLTFNAPPLPQTLIAEIENILPQVHPAFAYLGLRTWDSITEATKLATGLLISKPLDELRSPGKESVAAFHFLLAKTWIPEKRMEATQALVETAVSQSALPHFAVTVCSAILKYGRDLARYVPEVAVTKSENFLNTVLILVKMARHFPDMSIIEDVKGQMASEAMRLAFDNRGTPDGIRALIHSEFR
jgi:hypothetical protein